MVVGGAVVEFGWKVLLFSRQELSVVRSLRRGWARDLPMSSSYAA